jgi:hypothetical protein
MNRRKGVRPRDDAAAVAADGDGDDDDDDFIRRLHLNL